MTTLAEMSSPSSRLRRAETAAAQTVVDPAEPVSPSPSTPPPTARPLPSPKTHQQRTWPPAPGRCSSPPSLPGEVVLGGPPRTPLPLDRGICWSQHRLPFGVPSSCSIGDRPPTSAGLLPQSKPACAYCGRPDLSRARYARRRRLQDACPSTAHQPGAKPCLGGWRAPYRAPGPTHRAG